MLEHSIDRPSLLDSFEYWAKQRPAACAFTFLGAKGHPEEELHYRELRTRARSLAAHLREHAQTGDRAVLMLPTGAHFLVCFLACSYAGLIAVPIAAPRAGRSLEGARRICEDCRPRLVLHLGRTGVADELCAHCGALALRVDQSEQRNPLPLALPDPGSLAFLQYTSGSTSWPKGVCVTQANLVSNLTTQQRAFAQPEGLVTVGWLPLFHDMGLIALALQPLFLGGHGVLMPPETFFLHPYRWLEAIARYKAHTSGGPNFAYDLCVTKITEEQRASLDLSSWKVAFNGAEPVRASTLASFSQAFQGCGFESRNFYPCYGLAESTLMVTGPNAPGPATVLDFDARALEKGEPAPVNDPDTKARRLVGVGKVLGGQRLIIAAGEHPTRGLGEVCVQGPSVSPGYWGNQARADLQLAGEGTFLRTGDLGFLCDGELFLVGRAKDTLVIRGRNLHPEDLECHLEVCHPSLGAGCCSVFAVETGERELLVVALEVRRAVDSETLLANLDRTLASVSEVRADVVVQLRPKQLPRTTSGKLRRSACKELFRQGGWGELLRAFEPEELSRTGLDVGSQVVQLLSAALRRSPDQIPLEASFDELGLDSVGRLSFTGDLARLLNQSLAGDLTWRFATPASLICSLTEPAPAPSYTEFRNGTGTPLWVVHTWGEYDTLWFRSVFPHLEGNFPVRGLQQPEQIAGNSLEELAAYHCRNLQRHGQQPFRLLGYSWGSKLAYAIAHQLSGQGLEVDFVGIVDSYPEDVYAITPLELVPMLVAAPPRLVRKLRTQGFKLIRRELGSGGWVRNWLSRSRSFVAPPSSSIREWFQAYRCPPSNLRVTIFRTDERIITPLRKPCAGWGKIALGGTEVRDVGGDHHSLLQSPHVEDFARSLLETLRLGQLVDSVI